MVINNQYIFSFCHDGLLFPTAMTYHIDTSYAIEINKNKILRLMCGNESEMWLVAEREQKGTQPADY